MFDKIKGAFGGRRTQSGDADAGAVPPEPVSREQLLDALERVQEEVARVGASSHLDEAHQGAGFEPMLKAQLQREDLHSSVGTGERECLKFSALLFAFIEQDQNIPPQLRPILGLLRAPYTKLSILDEGFISADAHPGWRLLNNIALATVGWSPEFENAGNSLQHRIEGVVNQVLLDFERDPAVLGGIDLEFAGYVNRELATGLANEQRTVRTSRGTEKLQAVQLRVAEEIDMRLDNNPSLPKVVEVLLKDGWKSVLLMTGLRHGLDSAEWNRAVKMIDTLLWSVAPETAQQHRKRLVKAIPKIIAGLRDGLTSVSYDEEKMSKLLKKLQVCHIACVRGKDVWETTFGESTTVLLGTVSQEVEESPGEDLTLTDSFLWMGRSLPVGSWIELCEGERTQQRVKLVWKSEIADICLFVNRHGEKVMEMSYKKLASMLRDAQAIVLSDTDLSFRERAINAIVRNQREEAREQRVAKSGLQKG